MLEAKWRWAMAVLAALGGMAMSGETRAEELVIGVINPFTGPGADLGISSRQGLSRRWKRSIEQEAFLDGRNQAGVSG